MSRLLAIKVEILPDTSQQAARVVEALSNVLTGLAMEDIGSEIQFTPYDFEPAEEVES